MKGINFNDSTPLYEQVQNDLKFRIREGEFKIGEQIKSHSQLAGEYNVSLITIKKALSNLIIEGVLISRVGKGTFVADRNPNHAHSNHKSIGIVLRDLEHPFFTQVVQSIESEAYNLGFNALLSSSLGNEKKEEGQINHFKRIGTSGLVIASLSLIYKATKAIRNLHDNNFPYVMVSYVHDPDIWFVGTDHELGGFLAGEYLIQLGYKKLGYVHGGKGNILGEVRKNGFSRALNEYGIDFNSNYIYYLEDKLDRYHSGYSMGKQFIKLEDRPEAIFIYTDLAAIGFQKAILEEGWNIPDDIAIIGNDDIASAKFAPVPLTTIRQQSDLIGHLAAETVIKRINGEDSPNRIIVRPMLIARQSTPASEVSKLEAISLE